MAIAVCGRGGREVRSDNPKGKAYTNMCLCINFYKLRVKVCTIMSHAKNSNINAVKQIKWSFFFFFCRLLLLSD